MNSLHARFLGLLAAVMTALPGCAAFESETTVHDEVDLQQYHDESTRIEMPRVTSTSEREFLSTPAPTTLEAETPTEFWDLKLQEAIRIALRNSEVLRDLGGIVLRSPETTQTVYDPAIVEANPRRGVEAALSAFDANFASSAFFEKNDRTVNNTFAVGGQASGTLEQDVHVYQAQLTKRAATGTQYILRHNTDYDANNQPANLFGSAWNTNIEAEVRQPLLQGAGVEFNRVVGPGGVPGDANGVVVARMNTDISLAEFEREVHNFVSDVENAYWDLYFAYRDLEAKKEARDAALETWRRVKALNEAGRRGGEAEKEAQAREQYFLFKEQVQNALSGRLVERTRRNNGSQAGTFRATGGVYVAERRLRLLLGLPVNDGRMIRPATEPVTADIEFDWDEVLMESLSRRVELRRQKWKVERLQTELAATRDFLLPTLDAVGRYRWRGFGKDLLRQGSSPPGTFGSAFENLTDGNFQEWQLGVEFSVPLGRRRAHTAVRTLELRLARARTLLREQEREVVHDLSNAVADLERAHETMQTNYNRLVAARTQLDAMETAYYEAERVTFDQVLDAQRRLAEAESRYYRSLVEHTLAVKRVHYDKGSLLDYNEVYLTENTWPNKAYQDAAERASLRSDPLSVIKAFVTGPSPVVSRGLYPQLLMPTTMEPTPTDPSEEPPAPAPMEDSRADADVSADAEETAEDPPALPPAPEKMSPEKTGEAELGGIGEWATESEGS